MLSGFEANLTRIEKQYDLNFERIAVAVSGGADSLALAFLLNNFVHRKQLKIVALTVNHHLRPEADKEAKYVHELMDKIGVEHHILDWHAGKTVANGIEEKARKARYQLLEVWCEQNGYQHLFTAHHRKDQAETFMMRLQRGSGVDGLAAMNEFSHRGNINLIRPLLDTPPEDLQKYLKTIGVAWMVDSSNDCNDFLRVKIRKMLPVLEQELGISVKRIADTAQALGSVREYFEQEVAKFVDSHVMTGCCYASFLPESINTLPNELKMRVLGSLIQRIGGMDYRVKYDELRRLAEVLLKPEFRGCTLGACEIIKFRGKFWLVKEPKEKKNLSKQEWNNFVEVHPEYTKQVLPHKLKRALVLRFG